MRDLAERVRAIAAREEGREEEEVVGRDMRKEEHEHPHEFRRRESVDEVEETEKTTV